MKKFLHLLFLLLLFGCNIFENDSFEDYQNIFFEVQYVNHAWGYQHSGIYINKRGEVYSYKYNSNSTKWEPNLDSYYSEEDLLNKYKPNNMLIDSLDKSEVLRMAQLIPQIVQSNYSDRINMGEDIGAVNYICYYFNGKTKKYLEVIIEQEGDWHFKKQSAAADSVVNWLKNI